MRLVEILQCRVSDQGHFLKYVSTGGKLVTCAIPKMRRQLEILHNNDDGRERGSLLWLLDHTRTPFGSRLLRSWVAHPLRDAGRIAERLDAVEELAHAIGARMSSREICSNSIFFSVIIITHGPVQGTGTSSNTCVDIYEA